MSLDELAAEIEEHISHQVRWRRVMSVAYFTTAAAGITTSAAATVVAALGHSTEAALLAAAATVALGLEKALLFREKWTHHLNNAMRLEALKVRYVHGGLAPSDASRELAGILTTYAEQLPITPRGEAEGGGRDRG